MNNKKDFSEVLQDIGIHETRIPSIIDALNNLHNSLAQLDTHSFLKLKVKFSSLDDMFEASQTGSKKITFKKPRHPSVFTPRR